jgi:flagellin-like hook-associated protein FlgL
MHIAASYINGQLNLAETAGATFLVSTNMTDTTPGGGAANAVAFTGGNNTVSPLITVTQVSGGASDTNAPQVFTIEDPYGSDPTDAGNMWGAPAGVLMVNSSKDASLDTNIDTRNYSGLDVLDIETPLIAAGFTLVEGSDYGSQYDATNKADFFQVQAPSYAEAGAITFNSTLVDLSAGYTSSDPGDSTYATGAITGIAPGGTLTGTIAITQADPTNYWDETTHSFTFDTFDSNLSLPQEVDEINDQVNGSNIWGFNVTASLGPNNRSILFTSNIAGVLGDFSIDTTALHDPAPAGASLSYTPSAAYSIGLSNDATNSVWDSNTDQSADSAATFTSGTYTTSGVATISYSAKAGQNLSSSDLLNATDAQAALTSIASAITDIAAQDGYIGSQINTLNAVSQVLGTQLENVQSAQNAVQATDYASATSNMAKYEILMQTGISALAQANVVQQEVTKLLQ